MSVGLIALPSGNHANTQLNSLGRTLTYTVLPIGSSVIALLAQALEGADAVDALAIPTHLPHHG